MMTTPRSVAYSLLAWPALGLTARDALGHPSSGIVVNAKGEVFFQDAVGRSIWKLDRHQPGIRRAGHPSSSNRGMHESSGRSSSAASTATPTEPL